MNEFIVWLNLTRQICFSRKEVMMQCCQIHTIQSSRIQRMLVASLDDFSHRVAGYPENSGYRPLTLTFEKAMKNLFFLGHEKPHSLYNEFVDHSTCPLYRDTEWLSRAYWI